MVVQVSQARPSRDGEAQTLRPMTLPTHLGISGLFVQITDEPLGERNGAKRPAKMTGALGGCGPNGDKVAVANDVPRGVLGPQAAGLWADCCRQFAMADRLQPFVVEREGVPAAIAVAYPNGSPGRFDVDVQRMAPLTVEELSSVVNTALKLPKSVFIGPTVLNEEALDFHRLASGLAPQRALMAHPSLLHHPVILSQIGAMYGFVQMNYAEACILDSTTREIEKLACRARFLLGDGAVEFAITNAADRGLLWAEQRWFVIAPCIVRDVVCDIGAGDVWGAAFMLPRWYFGAEPEAALAYANLAAAAWISGRSIPPF